MSTVVYSKVDSFLKLLEDYARIRALTESLCETLSAEDCVIQSTPDASPTRWHLAHTTWFFEQFLLQSRSDYTPFNPKYSLLFNSYYNSVGNQFPRNQRGLLSRPGRDEVMAYRAYVDGCLLNISPQDHADLDRFYQILEIGLHHEQQHQELLLTDIKHALSLNPLEPVFRDDGWHEDAGHEPLSWTHIEPGVYSIGHDNNRFAYDNEGPAHDVMLHGCHLAPRLVTCQEYLQFMENGGYQRPELWLSLGWQQVQVNGWQAPLYWNEENGKWFHFTLSGRTSIDLLQPVCHVSYFEADAFARWAGRRLPTEQEWEVAARPYSGGGNFVDHLTTSGITIHPQRIGSDSKRPSTQFFGDVWEWTSSPYVAYPGYEPLEGGLGEYNGKFMCNQYVLRGGSCATSSDHIRPTYRNFFGPDARWQFTGIRLASDE